MVSIPATKRTLILKEKKKVYLKTITRSQMGGETLIVEKKKKLLVLLVTRG